MSSVSHSLETVLGWHTSVRLWHDMAMSRLSALRTCVRDIDTHAAELGWDRPPLLFALVPTHDLVEAGADLAGEDTDELRRVLADAPDHLTAVYQDDLAASDLGDIVETVTFSKAVSGCALAIERTILPSEAEADLPDDPEEAAVYARNHPDCRDVRITAARLRTGEMWCALRSRDNDSDDLVMTGEDLVPDLTEALAYMLS